MAKKSSKKAAAAKDAKKQKAAERAQAAKVAAKKAAEKAAEKLAAKKAAAKVALGDATKKAEKALAARNVAEEKARALGVAPAAKPDETELLKLALRTAEAKLVDAEHRMSRLEQELRDERRVSDDAAEEALEDAVVDAAVEATVAEALVGAEIVVAADPDPVSEAEVAELIADTLDEVAADVAVQDDEPSHDGEAAAAAQVFEAASPAGTTTVAPSELTPPLPAEAAGDEPNESWTVIRLREAAKAKGLTGVSNLSKSALLERLRSA